MGITVTFWELYEKIKSNTKIGTIKFSSGAGMGSDAIDRGNAEHPIVFSVHVQKIELSFCHV